MKTKIHPIKKLIAEGEHQQLDFKFEITDSARLARSLAAFANTDGGKLLIGVKDNGAIRGVRTDEEKYMLENSATAHCKPEVPFSTKEWVVDDKVILEVDIPRSIKHIYKAPDNDAKLKAYVRVKDQNLQANGVLMKLWTKRIKNQKIKFVYSKPVQEVLFYLRENTCITLADAIKISGLPKFKTEHLLSDLILLEIVALELAENKELYTLLDTEKTG